MNSHEQLLHYVWYYRLYPRDTLVTTDGNRVEVIDPGIRNMDAGPDFFNAKLRIGKVLWAGNVEIHTTSADWYLHGHHLDPAYNTVILHLVGRVNREVVNQRGETLQQSLLVVPEKVQANAAFLLQSDHPLPCRDFLSSMDPRLIRSYLDDLCVERLEHKCGEINIHLERFSQSWDEVFYVILTRNFGFGLNSRSFESLALSLPFRIIQRHSDDLLMVEALLFGQAGLLQDQSLHDPYYQRLQREYQFLSAKYGLKCMDGFLFRKMRIRPYSFPLFGSPNWHPSSSRQVVFSPRFWRWILSHSSQSASAASLPYTGPRIILLARSHLSKRNRLVPLQSISCSSTLLPPSCLLTARKPTERSIVTEP